MACHPVTAVRDADDLDIETEMGRQGGRSLASGPELSVTGLARVDSRAPRDKGWQHPRRIHLAKRSVGICPYWQYPQLQESPLAHPRSLTHCPPSYWAQVLPI